MDVDPYDLLDAVDILSKLPKDFYENMVRIQYLFEKKMFCYCDRDYNIYWDFVNFEHNVPKNEGED